MLLELTDKADLSDSEKLLCPSVSSGGGTGPALCRQLVARDEVQGWEGLGVIRHTHRGCARSSFPLEEILGCSVVSMQTVVHGMLSCVLPWGVQGPWCLSLLPKRVQDTGLICLLSFCLPLLSAFCFIPGAFICLRGLGRCPQCLEGKDRKWEWC